MKQLIYFFLESNIYLLIFLLTFALFLSNENNFKVNRFFLLFSMAFSLLFPIIPLNTVSLINGQNTPLAGGNLWLPEVVISAGKETTEYFNWFITTEIWTLLIAIYWFGLSVFLVVFSIQLYKLLRILMKTETYRWRNCRIMESKDSYKIFSFFNFIFIGKRIDLTPEEKAKVMEHEKVHADHLHSIDLILSDLLIIFFWFNPLIRIYKKKLIQQHEFEADSRAVENSEVNDYCNLLARVALISAGFSLANHFNNSLTIKRITMMQNVKKKINTWKIAGLIIIFPAVAFIAACQKDALNETDKSKSNIPASKEEIYTVVEKLAEFPGGNAKLGEFLGNNLKYPEESVKNGVEGIVYVSFTIDKEGAVHDPVIMKGISKECDAEALRVISLSPKWIPAEQQGKRVNQKMTLPIKFVMSQVKTPQTSSGNVQHLAKPITIETSQYVVNGKPRITGTVFNEARSPIEGATIVQMGTTLGTSTDKNGNFTIDPISSIGELSVSHVNYTIAKLPFNIK